MNATLPQPKPNADSLPYWDAARNGKLILRRCKACGKTHFLPRHLCPSCWSDNLEWIESRGCGTVHSFSVVHRAPTEAFSQRTPYVVALVDLDEGTRMFANIIGRASVDVNIGDRVAVTFEEHGGGTMLPQFERAGA